MSTPHPDAHGELIRPNSDAEWEAIVDRFGGHVLSRNPLRQVFRVVRANGCQSVVVENRYVDIDWRSDYSTFWSQRFVDRPAFTRRLHFFADESREDDLHLIPESARYLGYSVIRPVEFGTVGRTMVAPPPAIQAAGHEREAALTTATDRVTLFGNRLAIRAAPFCQQDTELLRCAHAAAWVCHYLAARPRTRL
jgi:hypothetical protein